MEILNANLKFKNALNKRKSTAKIVLHHAAAKSATVQDVHKWHLANGWAGIGYHFYVRKNGEVWHGRPIDTVGAHCYGQNADSIGICFEGNFEIEHMGDAQINAGRELIAYILGKYPGLKIYGHRDFNATACPGKEFPFQSFSGKDDKMNTLKNNSRGTDVKILQILLNGGGAGLKIDGIFGTATETAVKNFQKEKGLPSDGIAGVKTWAVLAETEFSFAEINTLKTKIANAQRALA